MVGILRPPSASTPTPLRLPCLCPPGFARESIVPGYDSEEGIHYPAATKVTVLTAMAAVSFVPTGDEDIDLYAQLEAGMAYNQAEQAELDPERIKFDAEHHAREGLAEIKALAHKLVAEGRVEFAEQVAA